MLKVEKVSRSFNGKEILSEINFNVDKGITLAIQGSSGCGKTTLLNIISGLDKPDDGLVTFKNQNIYQLSTNNLAQLHAKSFGFVFQFHYLLENLTVAENLILPLLNINWPHTTAKNEVIRLLKYFKMESYSDAFPAILSGGQRQKIAILRGIIHQPQIIFADEPTGNLDPTTTDNCIKLLQSYCRGSNNALVIVTHDNKIAQSMDQIINLS